MKTKYRIIEVTSHQNTYYKVQYMDSWFDFPWWSDKKDGSYDPETFSSEELAREYIKQCIRVDESSRKAKVLYKEKAIKYEP